MQMESVFCPGYKGPCRCQFRQLSLMRPALSAFSCPRVEAGCLVRLARAKAVIIDRLYDHQPVCLGTIEHSYSTSHDRHYPDTVGR